MRLAETEHDPRWDGAKRALAAELYDSGKSVREVAAVLGVSPRRAWELAREGGATMRDAGRPPTRRRNLVRAAEARPRMRALEEGLRDSDPSVQEFIAEMVGVDKEGMHEFLVEETQRAMDLYRTHYSRFGLAFTPGLAISLGFLQGVTFAAALAELRQVQDAD